VYFYTLRLLLLAGFCILLRVSPASGQQFTVEVQPSFTVTVDSCVKQSLTVQRSDNPDYVLIVTVPNCGPCIRMVENEVPAIRNHGIAVVVVQSDNLPEGMIWRHSSGPAAYIIDGKTRKSRQHWMGYTSADLVLKSFGKKTETKSGTTTTTKTVSITRNPSLFGRVGTSHESRATLINHLLNDGIHRGRWRLDRLNAMSDDQLNEAHSQDHKGTQ
jgi:hypothetical protein